MLRKQRIMWGEGNLSKKKKIILLSSKRGPWKSVIETLTLKKKAFFFLVNPIPCPLPPRHTPKSLVDWDSSLDYRICKNLWSFKSRLCTIERELGILSVLRKGEARRGIGKNIKGVRMLVRVVISGSKSEWEIEMPRWVWGLKNKGLCAPLSSSGRR